MSVLNEICTKKRAHVESQKEKTPLSALENKIKTTPPPVGFIDALTQKPGTAVIAEVKKTSPSEGVLRPDFDPVHIAHTYQQSGACCLSVLTDEPYFQGQDQYLKNIKAEISLPVLRKDFMIDPYQIYESRALGADCILLIMAALSDEEAGTLFDLSSNLSMDILVEVHNEQELDRALKLNPKMIGINNRNLKTLQVDVQTSFDLAKQIPDNIIKISESGLKDKDTLQNLEQAGYHGFLIGSSLIKQKNIGQALQNLIRSV